MCTSSQQMQWGRLNADLRATGDRMAPDEWLNSCHVRRVLEHCAQVGGRGGSQVNTNQAQVAKLLLGKSDSHLSVLPLCIAMFWAHAVFGLP